MPSEKKLQANGRRVRNQTTKQERRLWYDFLRTFEIQFYRQKVIENFIVDFYCAHAKIVVEVDGGQHFDNEGQHADQKRDARLTKLGYEVIRFTNDEVDHNFYEVCEAIRLAIKKRIS
jgi:very-short-patch-repair endonuclease